MTSDKGPTNWLANLLNDSRFADITVRVGKLSKEYRLHRAVLAHHSPFFAAAGKPTFKEGQVGEINLPDVDAEAFYIVLQWIYTGLFSIEHDTSADIVKKTYEAADFLEVDTLKKKISKIISKIIPSHFDAWGTEANYIDGRGLLTTVFENATAGDWENLKMCTDAIAKEWDLNTEQALELAKRDDATPLVFAALAVSYSEAFYDNFCSSCRGTKNMREPNVYICCGRNRKIEPWYFLNLDAFL
ncbi:hypothetical protein ABW19_dt0203664 [Dactylella cylindrospora]|nr:hypothetical protein ABW19_dt0203664 [Dactylella cylindrospora]